MKCFLFVLALLAANHTFSQKLPSVQIIQDSINSSFRGLSVPSDNIVWVSGSYGTVGRSVDGGKSWKWMVVPGFGKRDFRDIEAFDSLTAIIMAVDNPGNILKTTDGGKNWKVVFHKEQPGMFLDAMDFNGDNGVCIGDPVSSGDAFKNQFFIIWTRDKGESWYEDKDAPSPVSTEAIFASSGSNILQVGGAENFRSVFVTGGVTSNIVYQRKNGSVSFRTIPIMQGTSTKGAFSITMSQAGHFYITGGDYEQYGKDSGNVVFTLDAGKTWKRSSVHGYRSCIIQTDKKTFITCGTNGVDISFNGCRTFKLIHGDGAKGKDGFNVCAKSKSGKAVYFAGTGRIGKLIP